MPTTESTLNDPLPSDEAAHPGDQHGVPVYEPHTSVASLKERIADHYNIASDYYYSLWGQHIHHGLFIPPTLSKEEAQVNLIKYLLESSALPKGTNVLDVGCGIGGTSRYLAREKGCHVTGITISSEQVEIANRLTLSEADSASSSPADVSKAIPFGPGSVKFLELDAEKMLDFFESQSPRPEISCIWISEALSHLPNKENFFSSSFALLSSKAEINGRLVIADWFKAPDLCPDQVENDIKPIEDGMLLPRLYTIDEYISLATSAGFTLGDGPHDISKDVAKTWDISWSLVSSPSLWGFAISQGRDGLAFLQAFRAMRRGYENGSFRYAVMCFEKVE